ncbi:hypothetical protein MRB53_012982 [Persea americana]|uniref:Uncharacterized protein n=1 Tax=Persea americana TaxID=3435 RepID=A0ACC2LZA1_PERAE|nr:hypothetical protein MRB53_012982 [Persea americana]
MLAPIGFLLVWEYPNQESESSASLGTIQSDQILFFSLVAMKIQENQAADLCKIEDYGSSILLQCGRKSDNPRRN